MRLEGLLHRLEAQIHLVGAVPSYPVQLARPRR